MSNSSLVGLMPAPAGVTPDFNIHHMTDTQRSFILAYGITFGLATLTLGLRLYTRVLILSSFGLDDVIVLLAYGLSAAFLCIALRLMEYGLGRHLWEVTEAQLANYLKLLALWVATYVWTPAFTKLSILVLFHRLNPLFWFRVALYATAFMIIAYTLAISLAIAYPCSPLKANTGECLNNCGLWQAILNIITDCIIFVLPLHMLHHLNLPIRQKVVLGSVFSTGLFVIAVCVVRITYIRSLQDNPDVTYSQGRAAVWSSVELNLGIVCNTVVVLKPFMRQYFPRFFNSYGSHTATSVQAPNSTGGRFAKFSKDSGLRQDFPLSMLENEVEAGGERQQQKDTGIVVTKGFMLGSSKTTGTSTEDLVSTSTTRYSPP